MRCYTRSLFGVVIEVALHKDDRRPLIPATARQVAERTDQIGQAARRRALRDHLTHKVGVLVTDIVGDRFLEGVARQVGKVIVREVLELDLVGLSFQSLGVGGLTTGSASSQILPCGSLKAPSP